MRATHLVFTDSNALHPCSRVASRGSGWPLHHELFCAATEIIPLPWIERNLPIAAGMAALQQRLSII